MRALSRLVVAALFAMAILTTVSHGQETEPQKLKVFILAGQSNMVGHANVITIPRLFADERTDVQELAKLVFKDGSMVTRETVDEFIAVRIAHDELRNRLRRNEIEGDEAVAEANRRLAELQSDLLAKDEAIKSHFAQSDQVYINSIADRNRRAGPLSVGFGASQDKIGPELGFGMSIAQHIDGPVLLIKTSWGGKSLNYNFRSPSAGPYELTEQELASDDAEKIRADAGLNYRMMIEHVETVLADLENQHPAYDPKIGYEIAGFVWFQGFNDQFSDAFRDNYRENMVNFIKDVRGEFNAPDMPFVIGVLGTGITAEKVAENAVSVAQREAAAAAEFEGTVTSVESYEVYDLSALEVFEKGWQDHFAEWCAVGSDRPYHYLGSGKFFVRFGDALAHAMNDLMSNQD